METILPNATFIGFTGTPLMKKDKETSLEVFGPYIHRYKFDEAVRDKVVLDLLTHRWFVRSHDGALPLQLGLLEQFIEFARLIALG